MMAQAPKTYDSMHPGWKKTRRRRWFIVCGLSLAFLVLMGVSLYPTINRQGQYAALRARGVTTEARISYCTSNGGSAPLYNGVTITCSASFVLNGATESQDILGMQSQLPTGAMVKVLVDPRNSRDIYPLSDVRTDYHSGWLNHDTDTAGLAALLLIATIASQVIVVRKGRAVRSRH